MEEFDSKEKKDWRLLRRLLPYLKEHVFLAVISLICMLIMYIGGVLQPYLVKVGIDRDIVKHNIVGLGHTALLLLTVLFAAFVFQVFFGYAVQYLGQRLLFDLRLDLFKHTLFLSNDYFDKTPVGKTLTNITNDVEAIREFISEGLVTVAGESLKVFFILGAMVLINYRLALLTFILLPIFVAVTFYFRKSLRTGYRGVRRANSEINTILQESITGIREIIQFNYKEKSKENFDEINRRYLSSYLKVVHAYALYFPVIEVVANISMVVILFFAHSKPTLS